MYLNKVVFPLLLLCSIILLACPAKQEGTVAGVVIPPAAGIRVVAALEGRDVSSLYADRETGTFSVKLLPGIYDIRVVAQDSPFPVSFPGIRVEPATTTRLAPIELVPGAAKAILSGTIVPSGADTEVILLSEGRERAGIHAGADGYYEFTGLAVGSYTMLVDAPGYAKDSVELSITENQRATQNVRLLYRTDVTGVDWTAGTIKAVGTGLPPKNAASPAVRRAMAKRAALSDGQRNLLRIIERIRISPDRSLRSMLQEKNYAETIHGFIRGFRVVDERELSGGIIELDLELPLTGSRGLSRTLHF